MKYVVIGIIIIISLLFLSGNMDVRCGNMHWDTVEYPNHESKFCALTIHLTPKEIEE